MQFHRPLKSVCAVLAAMLMLGILTSCSGGGNGKKSDASSDQTLRIGYPVPPFKFDPATGTGGDRIWLRLIYDPLIELDAKTLDPIQGGRALAKSWKYTDDLTFNIKLRDGVKFQDGTPLDAAAVKASIERFQKISVLAFVRLPTLESIDVVGPRELNLKLSAADAWLPERLYSEAGMVVSPKAVAASPNNDTTDHPVGTGPYKLTNYVAGSKVTLERNDDYWGSKGGYKKIDFSIFANTVSMVQAFQAGQLDFMTRVPFADQKAFEKAGKANVQITPTLWFGEMRTSTKDPKSPLRDVRVRRAIDLGIDRKAINQLATEGHGKPLNQEFMPGYKYHSEKVAALNPRNVDEAKKLVAEVYPDGVKMKCVTYVGSYFEPAVPEIINEFKQIGIDLKIQVMTLPEANEKVASGEEYCLFTQQSAQLSPDVQLGALWAANSPTGILSDPDQLIDQKLLEAVRVTRDPEKVKAAVQAVMVAARKTDLVIPIFTRPESVTMAKSVDGYLPHLLNWDLRSLKPSK